MVDLTLILPCYNEAEHFNTSIKKIYRALDTSSLDFEIILVEDKSKDNTKKLIQDYIRKHKSKKIKTIYHQVNQGRGKSVCDGFYKAQGKYVGYIDIDCEVSPKHIPQFVDKLEQGFDVVYGERQYQITPSGIIRAMASRIYSWLVSIVFSTTTKDTEAGYKFFRRKAVLPVINKTKDPKWFWDTEFMLRAEIMGMRMACLPVKFFRREDKQSTVNIVSDTWDYLLKLIKFKLLLNSEKNYSRVIENYWQKKSPAFSNQYANILGIPLTPVGLFLILRHKKIARIMRQLPGKKLLDVGCGSGIFIKTAIETKLYPIGVDYSPQMLDLAKHYLRSYDPKKYKLLLGKAENIPLKGKSIDTILASGLTDYLSDRQVKQFMSEIKRVLKKNGHVIITFPKKQTPLSFLRSGWGLTIRKKLLRLPPMKTAYSKADIVQLLKLANLKILNWDEVLSVMRIVVGKKYEDVS